MNYFKKLWKRLYLRFLYWFRNYLGDSYLSYQMRSYECLSASFDVCNEITLLEEELKND